MRKILIFILFILFILSLYSATLSKSSRSVGFSFTNQPVCQLQAIKEQVTGSIKNIAHIKGFFLMTLLALVSFSRKKYLKAFLFVLALSFMTESLQMW